MEQDNTRQEKLQDDIDENEADISKLQIVIQKLEALQNEKDFYCFCYSAEVKSKINEAIDFCDNQIKFLEDLKESDERQLNLIV